MLVLDAILTSAVYLSLSTLLIARLQCQPTNSPVLLKHAVLLCKVWHT